MGGLLGPAESSPVQPSHYSPGRLDRQWLRSSVGVQLHREPSPANARGSHHSLRIRIRIQPIRVPVLCPFSWMARALLGVAGRTLRAVSCAAGYFLAASPRQAILALASPAFSHTSGLCFSWLSESCCNACSRELRHHQAALHCATSKESDSPQHRHVFASERSFFSLGRLQT